MRIITGTARGTTLVTLEGEDVTRPTAERVKEAVFSTLQFDLPGTRFLDLFAGSGQMGLEALSRGASLAVFVDASADAVNIIKTNAKKTKLFDRSRIVNYQYQEYLRGFTRSGDAPFDIIYLDPPFPAKLYAELLKRLASSGVADAHTRILLENENPDEIFGGNEELEKKYTVEKLSKYGRIYITWLRLNDGEEA